MAAQLGWPGQLAGRKRAPSFADLFGYGSVQRIIRQKGHIVLKGLPIGANIARHEYKQVRVRWSIRKLTMTMVQS